MCTFTTFIYLFINVDETGVYKLLLGPNSYKYKKWRQHQSFQQDNELNVGDSYDFYRNNNICGCTCGECVIGALEWKPRHL